jgi:hypothetical protein
MASSSCSAMAQMAEVVVDFRRGDEYRIDITYAILAGSERT